MGMNSTEFSQIIALLVGEIAALFDLQPFSYSINLNSILHNSSEMDDVKDF